MRPVRVTVDAVLPSRGETLVLDEAATHHLRHVLRCRPGQLLVVVGRDGPPRAATLDRFGRRGADATVWCPLPALGSPGLRVHLVLAVLRAGHIDLVLRMATELGAASFQPVLAQRCVFRAVPTEAPARLARWQTIVAAAARQCGRADVPAVAPALPLNDYLARPSESRLRLVLWEEARNRPLRAALGTLDGCGAAERPLPDIDVLVGPEGGLTEAEVRAAESAGFVTVGLGERILRAETAPVALLAILQHVGGGLQ